MASPTSQTEGLAEIITNIPPSYRSMLWFAVVALAALPVVMWVMDFAREWYINRVERNAKM